MLYHLALASDWDAAGLVGEYRVSSLGVRLESGGFIHASFAHQVRGVAERYYAGVGEPLVLLAVDESRLAVPWRVEPVPGPGETLPHAYPHVYGPINLDAVVAVTPVRRADDGTWGGLP